MVVALNLSKFTRQPFLNADLTLTRNADVELGILATRVGGAAGIVYASTVTNLPAGGIAATDLQAAINELDFEKQPKDPTLTALAGASTAADKLIYWTGVDVAAVTDFSAFARTLMDDANAGAMRTTLGLVAVASSGSASDLSAGTLPAARLPALTGGDATSSAGSANVTVGAIGGKAVVLGGALTTSGAFASTFTMTGVTGVTFPTTGTLATLAGSETLTTKTLTSPVINTPTGTVTLASGVLGYSAGNGGAVAQATDKSTTVVLSKMSGDITMNAAALNAGVTVSFTLTKTNIAATDHLILSHFSGGTILAYSLNGVCGAGSATVYVKNTTAGNLSEAVVIRFAVLKGANT